MSQESQPNSLPAGTPKEKVLSEDLDFFADCKTAFLEEKMPYANVLLLTICLLYTLTLPTNREV